MRFRLILPLLALAAGTGRVVGAAADDPPPPPLLATVSPAQVVENGKPIRLVLTGQNLAGVNAVVFAPQIPSHAFTVLDDQVIQVVLPATTAPGAYTIRVLTPGQGSDPAADLEVEVDGAPPPPSAAAAPVRPKYSFAPAPGFGPQTATTEQPATGAAHASGAQAPAAAATAAAGPLPSLPFEPAMIILAGLLAGGLGYALWGSAGRLATVRRTGLGVQLIGRPGLRLRLAHVCPGCTQLHWRWTTQRDLWRAGDYCCVGCLVDHGDELIEACYADDVASSRLHGMARLEAALDAETVESEDAREAYLPRLLSHLEHAEPEERLTGQPMAALLPAPELIPLPPAVSG